MPDRVANGPSPAVPAPAEEASDGATGAAVGADDPSVESAARGRSASGAVEAPAGLAVGDKRKRAEAATPADTSTSLTDHDQHFQGNPPEGALPMVFY